MAYENYCKCKFNLLNQTVENDINFDTLQEKLQKMMNLIQINEGECEEDYKQRIEEALKEFVKEYWKKASEEEYWEWQEYKGQIFRDVKMMDLLIEERQAEYKNVLEDEKEELYQ